MMIPRKECLLGCCWWLLLAPHMVVWCEPMAPSEAITPTAQQVYHINETLKIFEKQVIPTATQLVMRALRPHCQQAFQPTFNSCLHEFQLKTRFALELTTAQERRFSACCIIYEYRQCMQQSLERISFYSFDLCDETDVTAGEEALGATEKLSQHHNFCPNSHTEQFFCQDTIFTKNSLTIFVMTLGLVTVFAALLLSGYTFWLTQRKYIKFRPLPRTIELQQRNQNANFCLVE